MVGESIIITALLFIIVMALLKSKRKKWAVATLPVMLLPAVNSMAKPFCVLVLKTDFTFVIAVWTILIAVMASCIWTGFLTATLLNKRKTRLAYLFGCTAFNIILAAAFMWDHYHALVGEFTFF
ncbi:MAG TPA: hypothetical protein DDX91_08905 [Ruminococcaceae bacterium]|nr:hypothetical protein [Oscillospiraceae bacterium]